MRLRGRSAPLGAVGSQGTQAAASFVIQVIVARTLGFEGLGAFALLYGVIVLVAALVSGYIGDSLIVLDRRTPRIRAALQQSALALILAAGLLGAVIAAATGLVNVATAAIFGVAIALFAIEELMRRTLMAELAFWRVMAIDLAAFVGALGVIFGVAVRGELSLVAFFAAVCVGQVVAIALAIALLPRSERYLVAPALGGHGAVFRYGVWRAAQQGLRPAMLTIVRTLVTLLASLAATGLLEAGRIYVAPVALVVSGVSSYLFVSFARDRDQGARGAMRRADVAVLVLVVFTSLGGGLLVLVLPWLGPLLFGAAPDPIAVLGWLAYSASIAAVTPYGALAAVRGHQAAVFGLRSADTALAVALTAAIVAWSEEVRLVPLALAAASLAGGLAIRMLVLVPLARRQPMPKAA